MLRGALLKTSGFTSALAIVTACLLVLNGSTALATTTLLQRSLSIGTSKGGATTNHTFSFFFPISESVGSISFQYCTDPIDVITCVNPTGSDVSGAVLSAQTGETGFAVVSASSNMITIGRTPATVGNQQNSYSFDNIVNPSNVGPFFVRISAYASSDGSGTPLSFSSVAGAITIGINITSQVPDILYFCVAVVLPTKNCTDAEGYFIDLGSLSASSTRYATSQFLVGTNAANGYSVTANGPTMTSGSDIINASPSPSFNSIGSSQFAMNLRANLSPLQGADPTAGTGSPAANYDIPDKYTYNDGDEVASNPGRSTIQTFTVSYVININPTQPVGIYNTTITYVCTAGF